MSNTVEYKGNVYEIGKRYEFSDAGEYWRGLELEGFGDTAYPYKTAFASYKQIRAIEQNSIGTITKAPVKLIDGEAYSIALNSGSTIKGIYMEGSEKFYCINSDIHTSECTNIVKLVPEVK